MIIPLDFWTVSLFFAVTGITLLMATQLISAYEGNATFLIDQKKLRNMAVAAGILFLVTAAIRAYEIAAST